MTRPRSCISCVDCVATRWWTRSVIQKVSTYPAFSSWWLMVSITEQHSAIRLHEFWPLFLAFQVLKCGDQAGESKLFYSVIQIMFSLILIFCRPHIICERVMPIPNGVMNVLYWPYFSVYRLCLGWSPPLDRTSFVISMNPAIHLQSTFVHFRCGSGRTTCGGGW